MLDHLIEMSSRESRGGAKINRYWLPLERLTLDSIAIEGDDIWFYMTDFPTDFSPRKGIGQIKLKGSKVEFSQYVLSEFQREKPEGIRKRLEAVRLGLLSHEEALRRALADRIWRSIGQGIAAHDGHVWYGETEGTWLVKGNDKGASSIHAPKQQAFCKMNTKTNRVTKYLFPALEEDPSLGLFPFRLDLDPSGRRVWGTNQRIHAWIFDTATKKLKMLTIGKFAERKLLGPPFDSKTEELVIPAPEHLLRDVAVEPSGERGWLIDYNEALYLFDSEKGSILKYPLTGFCPIAVDLAPDGKVWCTSVAHERWQNLLPQDLKEEIRKGIYVGYILSLNPKENELTAYQISMGCLHPEGILAADRNEIWFGFSGAISGVDWGLSRFNPEENEGLTKVVAPQEVEDWRLAEYDTSEVEGEEISFRTFDIYPDQPVKHEYPQSYSTIISRHAPRQNFLFYSLEDRRRRTVRDLAQDSKGRIWFTTWGGGYVGALTL